MIKVENLVKMYGEYAAVDDLSFEVQKDRYMVFWGQTAPVRQRQ